MKKTKPTDKPSIKKIRIFCKIRTYFISQESINNQRHTKKDD